jgi:hypothetical protein
MTPRFYAALWVVFGVLVGAVLLVGSMTSMAMVIFGFAAFGLVFVGMMCVLPGTVSHPPEKHETAPRAQTAPAVSKENAQVNAYTYKSA